MECLARLADPAPNAPRACGREQATAGTPTRQQLPIGLPRIYYVAARGAAAGGLILVATAAFAWAKLRRLHHAGRDPVAAEYANVLDGRPPGAPPVPGEPSAYERLRARLPNATDDEPRRRVDSVARGRATAAVSDVGDRLAAALLVGTTVVVLAGWLRYRNLFDDRAWAGAAWEPPMLSAVTTVGTWGIGVFALGLIALGRYAYSSPSLRRTVGILWDLGTFWPRAAHPFAPPCYCERTVPEFHKRIARLSGGVSGGRGAVIVSAHSQGSIVAAATVLRMDRAVLDRISLLTYGSPLQRFYSRMFPHYFGQSTLASVRAVLAQTPTGRPRWRNCYRLTDPIGAPVFRPLGSIETDPGAVDRYVVDPTFWPDEDESAPPVARGHSNYQWAPEYRAAVAESVADLLPVDVRAARDKAAASTPTQAGLISPL